MIIPAIMEKTLADIQERIRQVEVFTNRVQIDVADGKFVPETTFNDPERLEDLISDLDYDIHLMVQEPEMVAIRWVKPKVKRILIHFEVCKDGKVCQDLRESISMVHDYRVEVGIVANPETPIAALKDLLPTVDLVQLMAVMPGAQGRPFHQGVLDRIRELRTMDAKMPIAVDGGITTENIREIKAAGATIFCVGSEIFQAPNPGQVIEQLKQLTA
jgi:ribulose-phosphate 3-epimerase